MVPTLAELVAADRLEQLDADLGAYQLAYNR
jgi:hypothetical protein